jgi:hypothetical protein
MTSLRLSLGPRMALTRVRLALRARSDPCIVRLKRETGQSTSDEQRTRSRTPPSNLLHSSGSPALRMPSNSGGVLDEWVCSDLRVSSGLSRWASAKADVASSILPSSAYAAAKPL